MFAIGKIIAKPKMIKYENFIEESVDILEEKVNKLLRKNERKKARWVCLKIIDGNEKILRFIEEKFNINFSDSELSEEIKKVENVLNFNGIKRDVIKDKMISSIIFMSENVSKDVISLERQDYNVVDRRIDKVLTSKTCGIPIMIIFLGLIFYITIIGANYPSEWLSQFFSWLQEKIIYVFGILKVPQWLKSVVIDGIYKTLTWVIAVMLPPMAIFFPLFTILEDVGFLPRIAFNLDKYFRKAGSSRKTGIKHVYGIWM